MSLREFLLLESRERVPDHSWLSRTRSRLPLEVHDKVFAWVLKRLAEQGLIKGERVGVDASTMEAHAALSIGIFGNKSGAHRLDLRMVETGSENDLERRILNRGTPPPPVHDPRGNCVVGRSTDRTCFALLDQITTSLW